MAVVLIHTHDGGDELAFERIGMAIEALTLRVREADPIPVSIEQSATIGKMLDTLTVEVLRKMKVQ